MRKPFFGVLAPVILLSACNESAEEAPPPAPDPAAALAAIDEAEQAQQAAFNTDDLAGATAIYAADARFFDAGSPVATDSDAIRAAFEGMIGDTNSALTLTRSASWVAQSGEMAVTISDYNLTYSGEDGSPMSVNGVNQTVWQKQADGSWKIVADFNAPVGEPTPVAPAPAAAESEEIAE